MTAKAPAPGPGTRWVLGLRNPPTGTPLGPVRKTVSGLESTASVWLSFPCASAHSTPNERSLVSVISAIVTSSSTWRGTTSIRLRMSTISW